MLAHSRDTEAVHSKLAGLESSDRFAWDFKTALEIIAGLYERRGISNEHSCEREIDDRQTGSECLS